MCIAVHTLPLRYLVLLQLKFSQVDDCYISLICQQIIIGRCDITHVYHALCVCI